MKIKSFEIYTFYRFIEIKDVTSFKNFLDKHLSKIIIRGTILVANEGINATISGEKKDLDNIIKLIKKYLKIKKLKIKISKNIFLPFNKIKVRKKKEIVSLGKKIDTSLLSGNYIKPENWNKVLKDKKIKVIDTRNTYEINIGSFEGSINPKINTFRNFPNKFENLGINKNDQIAIFCTGGIRCEKASAYIKKKGYKNIFQLEGGILNYLNYIQSEKQISMWNGECFVFDERVSIDKTLSMGSYKQCHGCRQPLSKAELESKFYVKGVCCSYCYDKRTEKQKERSTARQKQIDYEENLNKSQPFKKITKFQY